MPLGPTFGALLVSGVSQLVTDERLEVGWLEGRQLQGEPGVTSSRKPSLIAMLGPGLFRAFLAPGLPSSWC